MMPRLPTIIAYNAKFLLLLALSGCTTVTIDQFRTFEGSSIDKGDAIVLLGRRHSSDYETEPDLVNCLGDIVSAGNNKIRVIPESEFMDKLYPWFEPRTAPMKPRDLNRLMDRPEVAGAMKKYNIKYIVWVDGNTETTNSSGSIGCSIGTGGAGCFGFGTWDKESDYEASIWDYKERKLVGKISADASGTSYMPAVVIPIPLIARVQSSACKGMGAQLRTFLNPGSS